MIQYPLKYKGKKYAWVYQTVVWSVASVSTVIIAATGEVGASGDTTYVVVPP